MFKVGPFETSLSLHSPPSIVNRMKIVSFLLLTKYFDKEDHDVMQSYFAAFRLGIHFLPKYPLIGIQNENRLILLIPVSPKCVFSKTVRPR